MGVWNGIRRFWQALENPYYDALDWLEKKRIPVYSVVEPIDRIVPSLLVWLIVAAIIAWFFLFSAGSAAVSNQIIFVDSNQNALQGVSVGIQGLDENQNLVTDSGGKIQFQASEFSRISVSAAKAGYNPSEKTFIIPAGGLSETVEMLSLEEQESFFIQFVDSGNGAIEGKQIGFLLACSNPLVVPTQTDFLVPSEESALVTQPKNCGGLVLTVTGPAEFRLNSYPVSPTNSIVRLESADTELQSQYGNLAVLLSADNPGILQNAEPFAVLFRDNRFERELPVLQGTAHFSALVPGIYTALVFDRKNQFGQALKTGIVVQPGSGNTAAIAVSGSIASTVQVEVFSETGQAPIGNALVRLVDRETGEVIGQARTDDENGLAVLVFSETLPEEVDVAVQAQGFFSKTVALKSAGGLQTVTLSPIVGEGGKVLVQVQDTSLEAAEGARVFVLDSLSKKVRQDIEPQFSDALGQAVLEGVPAGNFVVWAEKGFDNGTSNAFETKENEAVPVLVMLQPAQAFLNVTAIDSANQPVAGATVSVLDSTGKKINSFELDSEGRGTAELKAHERITIEIEKQGFAIFRSQPFQLFSGQTLEFQATIKQSGEASQFGLSPVEITDAANNPADQLVAGLYYYAVFELAIPTNRDFSRAGAFFRIGDVTDSQQENVRIESAYTEKAAIIMGNSFNSANGEKTDLSTENLVSEHAVWSQAIFSEPTAGVQRIAIGFKAGETVPMGTAWNLYYRAWGTEKNGLELEPLDSSVLQGQKELLYAKADRQSFNLGEPESCSQALCFAGIRVKNNQNQQFLTSPFRLSNGSPYELSFRLQNNSGKSFSSISVAMDNVQNSAPAEQIRIKEFSLQGPGNQNVSKTVDAFETEPVSIGLENGKSAKASVQLEPNASQWSSIRLRAVPENSDTIEKNVLFEAEGDQQFSWTLAPETFVPLASTRAELEVGNQQTQELVEGATIVVRLTGLDSVVNEFTQQTNKQGKARFSIPASLPETGIEIQIQKNGYQTAVIQKKVESWLTFSPNELETTLGKQFKNEETLLFSVSNHSNRGFEAQKPELNGPFSGVLDRDILQQGFESFNGQAIPAGQETPTDFFKVQLDPHFSLPQDKDFSGSLHLKFSQKELKKNFVLGLPITVHALAGSSASPASCIEIRPAGESQAEWSDTTHQNKSEYRFTIINHCKTKEGKSISFSSLQGSIIWNGENTGNIEMAIQKDSTAETQTEILRPDEWSAISGKFDGETAYAATLTFTPKEESLGKSAHFQVLLAGKEENAEPVLTQPIPSNILIANLDDCLVFLPKPQEGITIPFGSKKTFSVDSSMCGNLEMQAELCPNDKGCKGGASKGELNVSPTAFSLNPSHPVQEVTVRPVDLAGAYEIPIGIQTGGTNPAIVTSLNVAVENDPNQPFSLDKFEFFVKENGTDSATLTNSKLSQSVKVNALATDWAHLPLPSEGGTGGYTAAGDGIVPEQLNDLNGALENANNSSKEMGKSVSDAFKKAEDQAKKAEQQQQQAQQQAAQAKAQAAQAQDQLADAFDKATNASDQGKTVTGAAGVADKACESGNTISGPANDLSSNSKDILGKLGKAKDTGSKAADQANQGLEQQSQALGQAQQSSDSMQQAQDTATTESISNLSADSKTASGQVGKAAGQSKSASNFAQNAAEMFAQAGVSMGGALGSVAETASQFSNVSNADTELEAKMGEAMGNCDDLAVMQLCNPAACAAAVTAVETTKQSFESQFQNLKAAKDAARVQSEAAKRAAEQQAAPQSQQGAQESQAAEQLQKQAEKKLDDLSKATPEVSNDAANASGEGQQNLNQNGAATGTTDGETNGIYENERITDSLTGFLINLKSDAKSVEVKDTPQIQGKFNTAEAKVFGEYRWQEAGIEFENKGIENGKPVYSTVTVTATEHAYPSEILVPPGQQNWGPYQLENLSLLSGDYNVEYHLKFNASEKSESGQPKNTNPNSCVQGALLGETGEQALPRIKLSWEWQDISKDACDASNPDYFYCDATQFSIMVSKRIHAVQQFLDDNPEMPCPVNQYEERLNAELAPFNGFLQDMGLDSFNAYTETPGCWLPKTTDLLDNKAGLEYFVEQSPHINWTDEIRNPEELHNTLVFDAYLIQDGYSEDFLKDFSHFYTLVNFADTPAYFFQDPDGKNYNKYFDQQKIQFKQKFVDSSRLPTSGLYHAELVIAFGPKWQLFDQTGNPSANIQINLLALEPAATSNPFYYLPLDGSVGIEGQNLKRDGYGVHFNVDAQGVLTISRQTKTRSLTSEGTGAIQKLSINRDTSLAELNSQASKRGFILDLESTSNSEKILRFTPSLATPVSLRVSQTATDQPFSAFFLVRKELEPQSTGNSLAYWSGMGNACLDFSGQPVLTVFSGFPDRKASQADETATNDWQNAYAIDWSKAEKGGNVFLKTIFFVPVSGKYSIQASGENAHIQSADDAEGTALELNGIATMPFNRGNQTESDSITALDDLFDLVKQGAVCITNQGSRTTYWWNPKALYATAGSTGKSLNDAEREIETGCIH